MALVFGISFAPNQTRDFVEWCAAAEEYGFDRVGVVDSQTIYRELYVSCSAGLLATKAVKIGPRVTNSLTRHITVTASALATLAELGGSRLFVGFGTGFTALVNIGLRSVKLAALEEFVHALRRLLSGETVLYQGAESRLSWSKVGMPIYIAAHGPKTLELAGRCADGVVVATGVGEEVVEDAYAAIARGASQAGRRLEELDIWWGLSAQVAQNREKALREIRMLLASKATNLASYPDQNKHVPEQYRDALDRIHQNYNPWEHQKSGAEKINARLVRESGLEEYLARRFAIAGNPDECMASLQWMEKLGVRKIWLNAHFEDKIGFMKNWSKEIMPYV